MSNIVLGSDGITIRQGIYEEKVSQMTDLGRFIEFQDGRRFRYCKADGEIAKGLMGQSPAMEGDQTNVVQTGYGFAVGAKDNISVALTSAPAAGEFADGFLLVNDGTGEGQIHKIRRHSVAYAPCKIWLYDKVITVVAETAEITLAKNRYLDVIVAPSTPAGVPAGVPLITVTDNYYFWAQTKGYCVMKVSGMLVVGENVAKSGTGQCALRSSTSANKALYGVCAYPSTNGEYAIIDLKLE